MRARRRSRNHATVQPDEQGGRWRVATGWPGWRTETDRHPTWSRHLPLTVQPHAPHGYTSRRRRPERPQQLPWYRWSEPRARTGDRLRFGQVGRVPTALAAWLTASERGARVGKPLGVEKVARSCRLPFPAIGIYWAGPENLRFRVVHCARTSGRFNFLDSKTALRSSQWRG
jgi:hypothetical protein